MFENIEYINKIKNKIKNFNNKEEKELNNKELDELEEYYKGNLFMEELINQAKQDNKITFSSIKNTFNLLQDNIKKGNLTLNELKESIIDFFVRTKDIIINGGKITISTIIFIAFSTISILIVLNPIIWIPVLILVCPILNEIDNLVNGKNNSFSDNILEIKTKINDIKNEIKLNEKYFNENIVFFDNDNYSSEQLKRFTESMIFKKIAYLSNIENKLYDINILISNEFNELNNLYISENDIEIKEDTLKNIEEINKLKKEEDQLVEEIKSKMHALITETLKDILNVRYLLKEKLNNNDINIDKNVFKTNIGILDENIKLLEEKMTKYKK